MVQHADECEFMDKNKKKIPKISKNLEITELQIRKIMKFMKLLPRGKKIVKMFF